ncbi:MAG: cbb3-type cytochrome oxidase subunit 3 [Bacteriovoracaceae bacterium]|jgi:cbb3-type cytochrome oxidase subunit 3
MKQIVLAGFNWTHLTNLALLLFLGLFISMLIWIFRKDSGRIYKKAASLPLMNEAIKKEEHHER